MTLHTTEPTCTQPSIVLHTTGLLCPIVCHHFREHGRSGQKYKRLFWKQIFGQQPIFDLKAQFAVCDYLHNVSHIIWLIMNRNRKACLAYVNNVCLRMLGCVHCARLCVSARLYAFLLGCVLCLAPLVLVIDGRTVFHDEYHGNFLYQHDQDKTDDLVQDCNIAIVLAMEILESCTKSSRLSNERRIFIMWVDVERRSLFP